MIGVKWYMMEKSMILLLSPLEVAISHGTMLLNLTCPTRSHRNFEPSFGYRRPPKTNRRPKNVNGSLINVAHVLLSSMSKRCPLYFRHGNSSTTSSNSVHKPAWVYW